jgi:excisionase family DNA binding protein
MGEVIAKERVGKGDDDLLTSKEVAPLLGVSHPKTVEKWVKTKKLPCVRMGRNLRFRRGDVLRWLAQRGDG